MWLHLETIEPRPAGVLVSALVLLTALALSGPALGANQHGRVQGSEDPLPISDVLVLDQHGDPRHFYTDLIEGKIVAINFVFTRCTMVCPMLGFRFGQLRQLLGPAAGTDIHLVSVSTDAGYDTPERMREWADKFNAGKGWTQITGDKQNVDAVLKALKAFTADKQDHSSLILLINDPRNEWRWLDGASDPQVIQTVLNQWITSINNAPAAEH